jgi:hypothetical protein
MYIYCSGRFSFFVCHYLSRAQGDKIATLTMLVKHVKVGFGANSSTYLFAVKGESNCGKVFKQIGPKEPGDKTVTVNIPGGREVFVAKFTSVGSSSFCTAAGSFKSETNKSYHLGAAPILKGCSIVVLDMDGNETKQVKLSPAKLDSLNGHKICSK